MFLRDTDKLNEKQCFEFFKDLCNLKNQIVKK